VNGKPGALVSATLALSKDNDDRGPCISGDALTYLNTDAKQRPGIYKFPLNCTDGVGLNASRIDDIVFHLVLRESMAGGRIEMCATVHNEMLFTMGAVGPHYCS
jgi:hypothetical protein